MKKTWKDVLDFWFDPKNMPLHFEEDDSFDQKIREEFLETWNRASQGLLMDWRDSLKGRLAEIIVLDQFSRNLFRNDRRSYSQDKMAIALSQEALKDPGYEKLSPDEKRYILLPFMHSESLELHDWVRPFFEKMGDENTLYFEKLHYHVLKRFGRYPYQNKDLARDSTVEELEYLEEKAGKHYSKT